MRVRGSKIDLSQCYLRKWHKVIYCSTVTVTKLMLSHLNAKPKIVICLIFGCSIHLDFHNNFPFRSEWPKHPQQTGGQKLDE